jgi:hypothetical protein
MSFRIRVGAALAALAGSAAFTTAPAQAASLSGVWQVAVTPVDCTSKAPLAPPFTSLLGFAANGTESEDTNNPALAVGQRSTAFGVWTKTGAATFHMDEFALILFTSTGAHPIPAGSQQIHQDITLSGNTWSSVATVQFYDTNGNPTVSGCATAAAARLS